MRREGSRMRRRLGAVLAGLCLAAMLAGGCSARHLTIVQDDYVNTGMQVMRPEKDRTGEPLEVDIVCVYPEDLKYNDGLRPDSITSREWFEMRPQGDYKNSKDAADKRFRLPKDRILVLCREGDAGYGRRIGPCLRGGKLDKRQVVYNVGFASAKLFDADSVIYVFGRFTDDKGNVLPVPPAVFSPPGKYRADISVRVGVRPEQVKVSERTRGQYILNTTAEGR